MGINSDWYKTHRYKNGRSDIINSDGFIPIAKKREDKLCDEVITIAMRKELIIIQNIL